MKPPTDTAITTASEYNLTGSQVAKTFHVSPKTVTRWADDGLLPCIRTFGGHRRYRASDIESFLERQKAVQ